MKKKHVKVKFKFKLKVDKKKTKKGTRQWSKYEGETITLNEYERIHFQSLRVVKDYWRKWLQSLMKNRDIKLKNKIRVSQHCELVRPIDCDNSISYIKLFLDALRHAGVIEDDTWQHVEIGYLKVDKSKQNQNIVSILLEDTSIPVETKKSKKKKKKKK